jgi:hypothetical protein
MKILKATKSYLNKQIFQISDLTFIRTATPLPEILKGEEMIEPIHIVKHSINDVSRMGANGIPYVEKSYSVHKGSQRIKAGLQLGYTHIEGIIINE